MQTTPHPIATWMQTTGIDDERLAALLRGIGRKASPAYLAEVTSGYYAPSRKLAFALEQITGVSAGDILTYPYRAPRAA